MKGNYIVRKSAAVLLVALMALVAIAPAPAAQAGKNLNPGVIPPQAHPYGHTYNEWAAGFFQWWLSIPAPVNPIFDQTGADCAQGQSGPVWYLLANQGGLTTRNCTVPAGKALFVSTAVVECSYAEPPESGFHGENEAEMRACAHSYAELMTVDEVTVDGVPVENLLTSYRFDTPLYYIDYPADNLFGVPGPGTTPSVGEGVFFMLAPLSAGHHTLFMRSGFSGYFSGDVTYNLTIGK